MPARIRARQFGAAVFIEKRYVTEAARFIRAFLSTGTMTKSASGKTTQTEKAYAALKRAILQGEIEEGTFLAEAQIMARYGIGRTPYREASNRLHHEGLLQMVPHHGFLVPEMSFHAVCELFEMRLILEDASAQLATVRATDHEIQALEKLAANPVAFEKSRNALSALVEANKDFHLTLAKATRNRRLTELLRQNLESTERLMHIELRSSGFRESEFHLFHERIVEGLKKRDIEAVRQALWNDITEGQSATLNVRTLRSPRALLGERYAGIRGAPQLKRASSGKGANKP